MVNFSRFLMQTVEKPNSTTLRSNSRISKEVAILLIGSDTQGVDFVEKTKTAVLSRHGAGIVSTHKLSAEQEMILIYQECNRETEIRIVGQIGSKDGYYAYGVAFLDPDIDFWGIEFPPATDTSSSAQCLILQCNVCGLHELIESASLESDIYAIHEGLFRDCKRCTRSTLWKRAAGPIPGVSTMATLVPLESRPAGEMALLPPSSANRRQHVRIAANYSGRVRSHGFGDDIVVCENVSRGGLCFKSSRRYEKMASIEVAAPSSPGLVDIPVSARIVYVQELPGETLFRYGVEYL